jgi:hypothetical protein
MNVLHRPTAEGVQNDRWIADIPKNSRETLRVMELVTVRVWYRVGHGEELRPSKEGFSLRVEKLVEFHEAIGKAIASARLEGHLG